MDKPKLKYTEGGVWINEVPAESVRLGGCHYYRAVIDDKPYYVRDIGIALSHLGYDEGLEKAYIRLKANRGLE